MSATVVSLAYVTSVCLALSALIIFHRRPWYWHMLSVLVAVGVAVMPPIMPNNPGYDLGVGAVFAFLLVWGLAGPVFPAHSHG